MTWKDREGQTVDELAGQLQQYEESLSSSLWTCISAVEKLSQEFQQFKDNRSYSPPVQTSISDIRSKCSSAQERRYSGYTPWATLWFYLRDHREDTRKWDGKPTSTLETREMSSEYYDQDKRGPASSQVEERDNQVYQTVWIRWPGTSDPQVDTGAQCTLMPSSYTGAEPICISEVAGGSQQLTVLEAEVSLTGNEWQKHPTVTGPEAPCILGIDCLRRGDFKDPKGYRWAFGIAALETEEIKQLSTLPGLSEDPSVVGLLRCQSIPQWCTISNIAPTETTRFPSISRFIDWRAKDPIWPVRKSNGEWRLTVDYHGLNEVTPLLSAAVPDMLELQYEPESKADKCTVQATVCFHLEGHPVHLELIAPGVETQPYHLPWTDPDGTGTGSEHLQYIDDIIVWGNTAEVVFEKGKKIVQILLKAGFAIKQSKVKEPAQEIQFLGIKWQDRGHQILTDEINKIAAMSPPTRKKETQAFLGNVTQESWKLEENIKGGRLLCGVLYDKLQKLLKEKVNRVNWQR
ncbi:LOW QUALITY PROTEIN: hypothetical protein QYF61_014180 [Mycteria americana]|uniref:Uncharacterized protein n=1 Tax=Mycteria americana TaxID=33587 RepID=A0AAN7S4Y0_MYCAM|nr:LOW QUALITY PROTEIN: hypothetical protein QYF61_014180 [Mycteria americana]